MIVIPSLNTSRDVIAEAAGWRRGTVSRATRQIVVPGGKPLNVARFLGAMGVPCRLVVLADAALAAEIAAILPPRVSADLFVTATRSRTDVALVEPGGRLTVVNGVAPAVPAPDLEAALDGVAAALVERDLLVIAGSQPPGVTERLAALARRAGARLLVDTSGPDFLAALEGRPDFVKVNAAELGAARGVRAAQAWRDGARLVPEAAGVVVTWGPRGLRGWLPDGTVMRVPAVPVEVVDPYGAGDAVTAALAVGLAAALPGGGIGREALSDAAAWAGAVTEQLGLDLDPGRAAALRNAAVAVSEGRWSR
jgi:1-phosphofructokinase